MTTIDNIYNAVALRQLLVCLLFHAIDKNASTSYVKRQLKIAGVTKEEIEELYGKDD